MHHYTQQWSTLENKKTPIALDFFFTYETRRAVEEIGISGNFRQTLLRETNSIE